jgi:hypothetical protein
MVPSKKACALNEKAGTQYPRGVYSIKVGILKPTKLKMVKEKKLQLPQTCLSKHNTFKDQKYKIFDDMYGATFYVLHTSDGYTFATKMATSMLFL